MFNIPQGNEEYVDIILVPTPLVPTTQEGRPENLEPQPKLLIEEPNLEVGPQCLWTPPKVEPGILIENMTIPKEVPFFTHCYHQRNRVQSIKLKDYHVNMASSNVLDPSSYDKTI